MYVLLYEVYYVHCTCSYMVQHSSSAEVWHDHVYIPLYIYYMTFVFIRMLLDVEIADVHA